MGSVMEVGAGNALAYGATPRTVRIALAGCGAVGSAFVRELHERRETIATGHDVALELCGVLVRDPARRRDVPLQAGLLGDDLDRFLATDADCVVEAIGGIEPARRIVESALRRGRTVVTANKALLAAHGTSLVQLAARHGAVLRYDAAVGGGVPILRLIDDALGAGAPHRVRGIFNGTTNFVQTALERGGTLEEVLADARRRGFAEADASRDLDGRDAADKLALVAWAAYGVAPEEVVVRRTSLLPDVARYTHLARRLGLRVRQLAECTLVNGQVVATVEPVLVRAESAFGRTDEEQNHVAVDTGWSAPLCASGPGAGGLPTATALLSDVLCTRRAPRRTRGRAMATVDPRRFRWAVEARCTPVELHRLSPSPATVRTNREADHCWMVIEDASRAEINDIVTALAAAGAAPVAARIDEANDACLP